MRNGFHLLTRNTYAERSRGARVSGVSGSARRACRGALMFTFALLLIFSCPPSLTAQTTVNYTSDSTMSDAMVANGGVENSNFGSQNQIDVYHQVGQQIPMVFRTFIQYDLSAIPENAIITEAKLKLVTKSVNNAVSHPIYIERVENTSWSEGTITWNNQPDVITADQLAFSHSQTSASGTHEFDVTSHVQHMVNNPTLNNGWRIRLQQETASADFGIMYNSSEASNATKRPVLTIEYILPIEMDPSVVHCTAGNNDGSFSIDVSGGSTYALSNMYFYKTNRDLSQRGKATLQNYKTTGNLAYDAVTGTVTASNLEPGIYILRILDAEYYANSDLRFAFYKHILVGREGETTSGILLPNYQYQENVTIQYDKPTNTAPLDRANTNYHSNSSLIHLRVADAPNNYEYASLIKYNMDFDDQLLFSKAELQINAYSKFYRNTNSSNAVTFSRVTSDWEESSVTWNTRPTIDPLMSVTLPATTTMGYEDIHKWDTVSVLDFVEHWQTHPDENFGFEIALETYGASQYAQRTYKSAGNNINYIQFDFTVKSPVTTAFNDTTNTGSLIVNAPSGSLPYTYLINTEPLGSLTQAWNDIKDWGITDSIDLFNGSVASTTYTFEGLPSGKYYVGVYDNTGTKILDANGVVNTSIDLINDTDLDLSDSDVLTRSSGAQGSGTGRLYSELLNGEDWGGLSFDINALGDFHVGFNKSSDGVVSSATDLEFGLYVAAGGAYQVIENNVLLASAGSVSVSDKIDIIREYGDYVIYINDTEIYRDPITSLAGENAGIDFALNDASIEIGVINYWGKFKKPGIRTEIDYPECFSKKGDVEVFRGDGVTISSASVKNNATDVITAGTIDPGTGNATFTDLPIGTYTLSVSYSTGMPFPVSYVIEEQVAVGYVVAWEDLFESYVIPLNTIGRGPGPLPDGVSTANSNNTTISTVENWVQFETNVMNPLVEGVNGIEVIGMKDINTSDEAFRLMTGGLFIAEAKSYLNAPGEEWEEVDAAPNNVWRIDENDGSFGLFIDGDNLVASGTSGIGDIYELSLFQSGGAQYKTTVASFCTYIPNQYVEPKRDIAGGYFLVPSDNTLRFEFNEEYTSGVNLSYEVRDYTGQIQTGLDDLAEVFGDNRFELDVSSLSSGTYLMEIKNDKGENWFIRFKVQ